MTVTLSVATVLAQLVGAGEALAAPPGSDLEVVEDPTDAESDDDDDDEDDEAPKEKAVREYTEKFVHFYTDPRQVPLADHSSAKSDGEDPYRGMGKKRLTLSEFYDLVGDETHVKHLRRRRTVRRVMVGAGGTIAGIAGALLVLTLADMADSSWCDSEGWSDEDAAANAASNCQTYRRTAGGLGGVTAVGLGVAITGLVLRDDPTPQEDRVRLATEYNAKLREKLGLSEADLRERPKQETPRGRDARLSATGGPGFGFVSLTLRF